MKACVKSNSWPPELAGGSTLDEDSSLRLQSIDREPWGSPMASLKCRVVAANTGSFSVSNSLFLVIAAPPGAQSHCIDHFAWIIKRKANLRTNFSHELTSPQRMPISHLASQYNERSDVWWRAKGNDSWEPRELALALPAAILPFSLSLSLSDFLPAREYNGVRTNNCWRLCEIAKNANYCNDPSSLRRKFCYRICSFFKNLGWYGRLHRACESPLSTILISWRQGMG